MKSTVILAVLALAESAAYADVACWTAPAAWNVPRGGAAFNRGLGGGGPVASVIDAINEHFVHSAVSHGPDSAGVIWTTHSTMKEPRQNGSWPEMCDAPVEPGDLANGWPGSRTNNAGGMWAYYHDDRATATGQSDHRFIMPPAGSAERGKSECMTDWYKNTTAGCGGNCTVGKGYSVYAYMAKTNTSATMCSSNIAYMYYWGKNAAGAYCTPDTMTNGTYDNNKIYYAAQQLYNKVYGDCSNDVGFWAGVGFGLACLDFSGPCDDAGDQVVNAFAYDQGTYATRSDHDWYDNHVSGKSASTISPDRVAGDYGHYESTNNSPYKPYGYSTVLWNSGGSVYGCWE